MYFGSESAGFVTARVDFCFGGFGGLGSSFHYFTSPLAGAELILFSWKVVICLGHLLAMVDRPVIWARFGVVCADA